MSRAHTSRQIFRNAMRPALNRYAKARPVEQTDHDQIKAESERLNEWRRKQIAEWNGL